MGTDKRDYDERVVNTVDFNSTNDNRRTPAAAVMNRHAAALHFPFCDPSASTKVGSRGATLKFSHARIHASCTDEVGIARLCPRTQKLKETAMKPGDYVKIIGRDGFYMFLKEAQGTATLQIGGAKNLDKPCVAVPMSAVVSLEKTE
jgi:hypothetical protein